jgi:ribosomal protein S27AE
MGVDSETCPLCAGQSVAAYHRDKQRPYLRCARCQLVFVPAANHLSATRETRATAISFRGWLSPYSSGCQRALRVSTLGVAQARRFR